MEDRPTPRRPEPEGEPPGGESPGGHEGLPRRAKAIIGVLAAVVVGLVVGLVVVLGSDGDEDRARDEARTVERTVTETTTETETVTQTVTGPAGDDGAASSSPEEAARAYADREMDIELGAVGVARSREDPDYAIVTPEDAGGPETTLPAVWVKREDGGWRGVAGTFDAEPPPSSAGVPDDISRPYSDF